MKKFIYNVIAFLLCATVPSMAFAHNQESGFKAAYDGGTVPVKIGVECRLQVNGDQISLVKSGTVLASVPATSIIEISYGQDTHRRVGAAIGIAVFSFGLGALMLLSKSKKHFIGLTYADADGKNKGGFVVQADKDDYRGMLLALEGVTGKKAVDSDTLTVKN
jgi:hypothetical protein